MPCGWKFISSVFLLEFMSNKEMNLQRNEGSTGREWGEACNIQRATFKNAQISQDWACMREHHVPNMRNSGQLSDQGTLLKIEKPRLLILLSARCDNMCSSCKNFLQLLPLQKASGLGSLLNRMVKYPSRVIKISKYIFSSHLLMMPILLLLADLLIKYSIYIENLANGQN